MAAITQFSVIDNSYRVEKKEADAKRMMETVLVDRQKIEDTIAQLDQFKREAMEKTWTTVNSSVVFG